MKNENIVDTVMITTGSLYSLTNIEHILGIILLVFQIIWISVKLFFKLKKHIRKEYNDGYQNKKK